MAIQWHPLFAELLRPLLEKNYEVRTNVPVGDVPREADVVVLRRMSAVAPVYRGLWRHLKTWNVLEYKGRSVSARINDVDLLVELGLGIHRRLNEDQAKEKQPLVPAGEMGFWYVANHLGQRFLHDVAAKLGSREFIEEGVWQGRALHRDVFLISGSDVKLELDSLPFFILGLERIGKQSAVPRLLLQNKSLTDLYSAYLEIFHHEVFQELESMARTAGKKFEVDLRPAVERFGLHKFIEQIGIERFINEVGKKRLLAQIIEDMSPQELAKLKRQLDDKQ